MKLIVDSIEFARLLNSTQNTSQTQGLIPALRSLGLYILDLDMFYNEQGELEPGMLEVSTEPLENHKKAGA